MQGSVLLLLEELCKHVSLVGAVEACSAWRSYGIMLTLEVIWKHAYLEGAVEVFQP